MIGLVVVVVVVWLVVVRVRRRRLELAGRIAERPTFAVEPPSRRMGKRSRERL